MSPRAYAGLAMLVALIAAGCDRSPGWLDPRAAPSPVKVADGVCLDLHRLPAGWKVTPNSTSRLANFGLPGKIKQKDEVSFDTLVSVSDAASTDQSGYRDYVEQWTRQSPPKTGVWANRSAWDVPGFKAYPADDGETVFIGEAIDATMECESQECTVHDGIQRHPVEIDFRIGPSDRRLALDRLRRVRQIVDAIKVRC